MTSKFLTAWLNNNYEQILVMASKITRNSPETQDLAHYSILHFMEHTRAEELVEHGQAMRFLSGIMWRSFHSSTSVYHTQYRQKGRVHAGDTPEVEDHPYDHQLDQVVAGINEILDQLLTCGDIEKWYHATLFGMWVENPNFSQLSRATGIPRTSISHAIGETRKWVIQKLKEKGIEWN